ncbi:uncharacterized protein EDB91DRAFT_1085836 [Suillus paluster]|uniref:uncharacterized protein n=1 Tax=Suillus paluster TaxID=48578 RepID=UPI001B85E775|nr:uncharacterized protein EDB91DRAFT_1085836 [Suillus paluster]KAG1729225.1 hypothetical protein EDB91DRAFT_1085836 [Suillus paluster]
MHWFIQWLMQVLTQLRQAWQGRVQRQSKPILVYQTILLKWLPQVRKLPQVCCWDKSNPLELVWDEFLTIPGPMCMSGRCFARATTEAESGSKLSQLNRPLTYCLDVALYCYHLAVTMCCTLGTLNTFDQGALFWAV